MRPIHAAMCSILLLLPCSVLAAGSAEQVPATHGQSVFSKALFGRILACFELEGGKAGPDHRAALRSALPGMLKELEGSKGEDGSTDCLAHQSDTCAEPTASMACEDLGMQLRTRLVALRLPPPSQAWAGRYAGAVTGKILGCLKEETGEEAGDAQQDAIGRFQGRLGHAVAREAARLECKPKSDVLDACARTIEEIYCSGLAIRIGTASGNLVRAMPSPCDAWLECPAGADAIGAVAEMLKPKK
jgi:hypothetical protein